MLELFGFGKKSDQPKVERADAETRANSVEVQAIIAEERAKQPGQFAGTRLLSGNEADLEQIKKILESANSDLHFYYASEGGSPSQPAETLKVSKSKKTGEILK